MMFAILSDSEILNDKIDLFVACAPIVYLSNQKETALKVGATIWYEIYEAMKSVGVYEINDKINVDYKKACNMF